MQIELLRQQYHKAICEKLLSVDKNGIPSNADKHSEISVMLAKGILKEIGVSEIRQKSAGQTAGKVFEQLTLQYLESVFQKIQHLRPGKWRFSIGKRIEEFEQYEHLPLITEVLNTHKELRAAWGSYIISPDIVIGRLPVSDNEINSLEVLVKKKSVPKFTPLHSQNSAKPILHASISCKWTIRSDRSQNSRTEALNLIRSRKGHTPHIVIVTAEPYPQRIASLAFGTGDIDCVYHFALPELQAAVKSAGNEAVSDMTDILISGKRLRDISDLPFDLAA